MTIRNANLRHAESGDELVFLPLGGSNEIGMNFNLYGFGPPHARKWIVVDLGVTFGDQTTPGVELILPDPTFIEEYAKDILGIVLTHAHEDHIGAVAWLWPRLKAPLYATPFTAFLLREKLREKGLLDKAPITEIPLSGAFTLGPFELTLLTLTHSIPEPNGVAIRTPLGTVLHTGDWKIDPDPLTGPVTDEVAIRRLGDEGILAMVCDSTNVFVDGEAGSEADVRVTLNALIGQLKGKVAAACFASNVARMDTIIRAAEANGRRVCLVGRSMIRMSQAARSVGLLEGVGPFISDAEARHFPDNRILYLCTGSQGEVRAALARVADGSHPHVKLGKGDSCVFSSRIIPGNEIPIRNMQTVYGDPRYRPSPWLVTTDEITNPQKLGMWLDVNGTRRQTGNTKTMIFSAAKIVSYVSQFFTLMPGDVICTGTPPGVGLGMKPNPVFLRKGDVMTLGIEGLGEQRQLVVPFKL